MRVELTEVVPVSTRQCQFGDESAFTSGWQISIGVRTGCVCAGQSRAKARRRARGWCRGDDLLKQQPIEPNLEDSWCLTPVLNLAQPPQPGGLVCIAGRRGAMVCLDEDCCLLAPQGSSSC